ncbi:MAG: Acryloyl-CoA reductase (NADH) [Syntrophorhabdaceae bacterium PtaU1.Bin034]|nr:MAG: Acryloyl-CoA reductase (NADH) [Syntrophorhabdaceae bacterium PtaU1.Bin034]
MELTAEQKDIRQAAREFAEKEFTDVARELDEKEEFDDRIWKKAAELGFLGVFIDEEYGGPGLGHLEQCLIIEEFARVDTGIAQAMVACYFGSQLIKLFGTEEQKQKYLRPIVEGTWRCGMASTEPDAGSDVAAITTTAIKDNGDYVISGNKMFITNANIGNYLVVLCVTDPKNPRKHDRLSTIIVETDRPGYEANKLHRKLSIRCSDTGECAFKEVRVPQSNLVGKEGKGFYQLMDFFNRARLEGGGALAIGTAQGALDKAIAHVKKRKAFGSPLGGLQVVQAKIAEMATLVEAGRSIYWRAAMAVDRGQVDPALIAMSKWYTCEIAVKVADEAIQLHGGYGILEEYDVAHYWRDAKVLEIFEGTKEVEKVLIGKKLLQA